MTSVTVSPKYQIVIPKAVRESMGIVSGQKSVETIAMSWKLAPGVPKDAARLRASGNWLSVYISCLVLSLSVSFSVSWCFVSFYNACS